MKKSLFFACLLAGTALFSACEDKKTTEADKPLSTTELVNNPMSAEGRQADVKLANIEFDNKEYDFGEVVSGEVVKYAYKFKNTGEAPLIVENATASCGCTVPKKPTEPIAPGEEGEIYIEFNSLNRIGSQRKTVTVLTNSQPSNYPAGAKRPST